MSAALASTSHLVRATLSVMRRDLIAAAQYRANMAIWSVASILQIVVYLSVWRAVADAAGGAAGGYSAAQFAGYFLVLLVVRDLTYTWLPYEITGHVRQGSLAPLLLRPFHPLAYITGGTWAFRMQSLLIVPPVAAVLFFVFDARVDTTWQAVAATAFVIPFAALVRMLLDMLVGLCAVWAVRIDGLLGIYYTLLLLLGGQFAPLGVLPSWLQAVAKALPFWWTLGYPTELLAGRASVGDAWIAALVLGTWSILLLAVLRPFWRAACRRFEAVGQ